MPQLVIVGPALADANNGNWQTARRWQQFLAGRFRTRIIKSWPDQQAAGDVAMIALHARRSAASIAAWHATHGDAGLAVVLTGTDLYKDILVDAAAQRSLQLARFLVVLQELAPQALPAAVRGKARVIFQSTTSRQTLAKSPRCLRAVMVGHLREEKSPQTLYAAARLLADRDDIRIDHIGDPLDAALGAEAQATMAAVPGYRWLGGLPHETVRRRIQRAHLLIHASRIEGSGEVVPTHLPVDRSEDRPARGVLRPGSIDLQADGHRAVERPPIRRPARELDLLRHRRSTARRLGWRRPRRSQPPRGPAAGPPPAAAGTPASLGRPPRWPALDAPRVPRPRAACPAATAPR